MWRGVLSFHSAQTEADNARFLASRQIQWKQELPVHNFFRSLKKNPCCPPMAALKFSTFLAPSKSSYGSRPLPFIIPNHRHFSKLHHPPSPSPPCKSFAATGGAERGGTEDDPSDSVSGSVSSARSQLGLLEQLTSSSSSLQGYESDGSSGNLTIRDQLSQLVGSREGDFIIPLGKNLKKVSAKFLTTSQKRNIKRQSYLNEVSRRNDSVFFATVGAFILLPPIVILGIAIATGYVQLFP